MTNPGFVYVLINQSMEGYVKIGKTSRNPKDRAKELSAVTGVPTPFLVAYDAFFNDCTKAEEFIHLFLEKKGYRISDNKEFFNAPLREVIHSINEALRIFESIETTLDEATPNSVLSCEDHEKRSWENKKNWIEVFNQADAYYEGSGDTLQDYSEALRLYKQAMTLGCIWAYAKVGFMYELGEGCQKDNKEALRLYQEAAKRGQSYCYAHMARIYLTNNHIENTAKCWKLYFDNTVFTALANHEEKIHHASCCLDYFDAIKKHGLPATYVDKTEALKHDILEIAADRLYKAKADNCLRLIKYYANIIKEIEQGAITYDTLNKNDRIKVIDGPFVGYYGYLTSVDSKQQRVTAMMDVFGKQVAVDFVFDQVEKVEID